MGLFINRQVSHALATRTPEGDKMMEFRRHLKLLSVMKINKIYIVILELMLGIKLNAQPPVISWQKCIGGTDNDIFYKAMEFSNNKYIFGGPSESNNGDITFNHGNSDLLIIATDSSGNIISQKSLGGSNSEGGPGFTLDTNNSVSYLDIVGGTSSNNGDVSGNHMPGSYDGWFVQLDTSLNLVWQKCYGGTGNESFENMKTTPNHGYILVGSTNSTDGDVAGGTYHGGLDGWIVKLDSLKNIEWNRCYGGSGDDVLRCIFPTPDSGYIVGGFSNSIDGDVSTPLGSLDFWVLKIDSNGAIQWDKSFGGTQDDLLYDMIQCADGGYALIGRTSSRNGFVSTRFDTLTWQYDFWLLRLDSIGNFKWEKCYGGNGDDIPRSISETADSGLLISGSTRSNDQLVFGNHGTFCFPEYCDDQWLIKTNAIGNLLWQKCIGGSDGEIGTAFLELTDHNYLVTGLTYSSDYDVTGSYNHGNGDAWVVKLSGLSNYNTSPSNYMTDFACHYNSLNHSVSVSFYSNQKENAQFELLDIAGRVLLQKQFETTNGFNKQQVNAGNLSTGIYFVRLITTAGMVSKKLIVE
jgi:hypothetical protein